MNRISVPKPNAIDRLVGFFSPKAACNRLRFKAAFNNYSQFATTDGTGYRYGGSTRATRGWVAGENSADEDTLPIVGQSRASARDLFMNSPVASAALRRVRTNVTGAGLQMQSRIDREFLKLSDDEADNWEKNTEREWRAWSKSKECDAARSMNFAGLQRLAFFSTLMNGDTFANLPFIARKGSPSPYKLKIQLIEADYVSNPSFVMDTRKIAGGVEVDSWGAPVAYHVRNTSSQLFALSSQWKRIPVFGARSHRRNILHLNKPERIGQRRGMPYLSGVIEPLKQLTRLSESELTASIIASFFTVFVKTNTVGGDALQFGYNEEESILNDNGDGTTGKNATARDNNLYEIGPGLINELGEDQEIQIADAKRPSGTFDPFFSSLVRQIGASIEVPYEQLMLAFTSSYSASRAALLEAWKFYKAERYWLADEFCQPVYDEWLSEAILLGRISAPGFFEDPLIRQAWNSAVWIGPGQGQIDPLKETKAAREKINGNLSTHEDEYVAINGGDWDSAMQKRGRENRVLNNNGLMEVGTEPEVVEDDLENQGTDANDRNEE